jgi:hypothetical protein
MTEFEFDPASSGANLDPIPEVNLPAHPARLPGV